MKNFLFWATVVGISLTGCVNDNEVLQNPKDNLKPVTFEVAKYKASSRADETANNQVKNEGSTHSAFPTNQIFGTFAYVAPANNGEHSSFMNNEKVGYVNNVWVALGDTYFWPQVGHVDFISYYPHSTAAGGVSPIIGDVTSGDRNKLSFENYTVSQVDLMYSDKAHLQTHNYDTYSHSGVPTLFRHALAKLSFEVKSKYIVSKEIQANGSEMVVNWQVLVKSIRLNGLHGTGSVYLQTTSPTTAGTTQWDIVGYQDGAHKVWTPTGSANVSKEWTVAGGQSLNTEFATFSEARDYYVLPQSFTNQLQSVTIVYSIANKEANQNDYDTPTEFTKTLYFYNYNQMVTAWEMGKSITYQIQIDPKGDVINFDPAVADWEVVTGTLDI